MWGTGRGVQPPNDGLYVQYELQVSRWQSSCRPNNSGSSWSQFALQPAELAGQKRKA